jgi:hypothetical protein
MLVALTHHGWSSAQKNTIVRGLKGLKKTCPGTGGSASRHRVAR